jgi:hypothetical protein
VSENVFIANAYGSIRVLRSIGDLRLVDDLQFLGVSLFSTVYKFWDLEIRNQSIRQRFQFLRAQEGVDPHPRDMKFARPLDPSQTHCSSNNPLANRSSLRELLLAYIYLGIPTYNFTTMATVPYVSLSTHYGTSN